MANPSSSESDSPAPRWLIVSNGHGEDLVGARLAERLSASGAVQALPLVGAGRAYREAGIPVQGPVRPMPSGGFVLHDRRALLGDLRAGLVPLVASQLRSLCALSPERVVAVGDLLPVVLGRLTGAQVALVGVNKSDHYRFAGSRYFWAELALLKAWGVLVFPRDERTHHRLRKLGVESRFAGNPLMDVLGDPAPDPSGPRHGIGLLPGSRDDALRNLGLLLPVVEAMAETRPGLRFYLACGLPDLEIGRMLGDRGWEQAPGGFGYREAILVRCAFPRLLHASRLVLGLAGTANEQAVGMGIPLLAFPVPSGQYDAHFARLQAELLGPALRVLPYDPRSLAGEALVMLDDEASLRFARQVGRERMGGAGALAGLVAELEAWADRTKVKLLS